ncbi:hypothetical protein [Cellulomonas dongxiuzhuiae]|uniref:hypothetical protein n=1 Tax=Cellulomonas dongxiuzhuiae TaxID=2819979 RepID=UPI001AB018F6|nr:hypothetical protein [Cellulomonas dongxiuzhuiae]MBO3089079.1 hypothetical protein [Cellulomonas dongxiuzhuiae]
MELPDDAKRPTGVIIDHVDARLSDDGTGTAYARYMELDLVVDSPAGGDLDDLVVELAAFDENDVLLNVDRIDSDRGFHHDRVLSRDGARLHLKYRQLADGDGWTRLARLRLAFSRQEALAETLHRWAPQEAALEVTCAVEPALKLTLIVDRAVVLYGYDNGYVVSVRAHVSHTGSESIEGPIDHLFLPPLQADLRADGFLYDESGSLVDNFRCDLTAGRATPASLLVIHPVSRELPLTTRVVLTVRLDDHLADH